MYPKVVLNLAAGDPVDDDIAAFIPEDVWEGKAARDLHVVIVAPLAHSEEYSDVEGVRVVPVHPPPGYQTRVLSAGVNYAQARALLARCERSHGTAAGGDGKDAGTESVPLPDLMVIDCVSEQLVPAGAGCRFAALSYVWGHSREGGNDEDDEEEPFQMDLRARRRPLPRTVRDAMHVVRELGLQFLWVDRYCIDDNDDDDDDGAAGASKHRKHHTISNMDAVYQRAALTIVAASGAHSDHGLPGARRIHRRLDTYSLAENGGRGQGREAYAYIEEAHAELSELVWSTRGWTYQEGLLSRHRLVFTETQASFQCQQHNHNHHYHNSGSGRVAHAEDIFYRIEEYTRRHLTYPADSLRAFLGVLRAFEKLSPPVEHLWGVPFVFGADGRARQPAQGLLWKSQSRGLRRIPGTPSWSWAGWEGWADQQGHHQHQQQESGVGSGADHAVRMYGLLPVDPSLADLDDALVEVPSGEGAPLGLEGYFRAQREGRGRRGMTTGQHAIYVTAWTAEVSFAPGGHRREYVLDLDARSDFGLGPAPAVAGDDAEETWIVAVICWALSRPAHRAARGPRTQCLVLERAGTESFSRVGTLETRWRKEQLQEDGEGAAHIAASGRNFLRRRLRIV